MNLLKADFFHLVRDKVFYVLTAITFIMPLITCLMISDITVERTIFQGIGTSVLCPIIGIMIALFVGKDYANNTIRNKICYGEKRFKVMGITFLESAIICLAFVIVSVLSSLIFGSIFGSFALTADFAAKFFCQILILLAFSAAVAAITMCSKSMKTGLVVTLMISVILSSIAQILPMLAVDNGFAYFLCRVFYATVSGNLLNSVGGAYVYTSFMQFGGASITFNHMYLNSIILSFVYILIAVGVTTIVVKKQSYK